MREVGHGFNPEPAQRFQSLESSGRRLIKKIETEAHDRTRERFFETQTPDNRETKSQTQPIVIEEEKKPEEVRIKEHYVELTAPVEANIKKNTEFLKQKQSELKNIKGIRGFFQRKEKRILQQVISQTEEKIRKDQSMLERLQRPFFENNEFKEKRTEQEDAPKIHQLKMEIKTLEDKLREKKRNSDQIDSSFIQRERDRHSKTASLTFREIQNIREKVRGLNPDSDDAQKLVNKRTELEHRLTEETAGRDRTLTDLNRYRRDEQRKQESFLMTDLIEKRKKLAELQAK